MNPQKYGNSFNDVNTIKKDQLINSSINGGYGNSLINDMNGCPIQKVHKMKQKKRDKLKKYLYQGKEKNGYEYNKYKLQNGTAVSIDMTPDYKFKRVMEPYRASFHDAILNQIQNNNMKRAYEKRIEMEEDKRTQHCYDKKMAKLEKKQLKNKESQRKNFLNDIDYQVRQKYV